MRRKSHKLQDSATCADSSEEVDNVDEINETDFTQDKPNTYTSENLSGIEYYNFLSIKMN